MNEIRMAPTVDIIIVNYKTPALTIRCANSILNYQLTPPERVTIIDNASGDDSPQQIRGALPHINVVALGVNGGFGAGVNAGGKLATGDILLFLNPDTYFFDRSLHHAVEKLQRDPELGIVGLDLINPDGSRQYSSRRFYSLLTIVARRTKLGELWPFVRLNDAHLMKDDWHNGRAFAADWVMGTGFLIKKSVFDRVAGMDEAFFLYMEDVDLCARVWKAGFKVECIPGVGLVHDHQRASAKTLASLASRCHINSFRRYLSIYRVPLVWPPTLQNVFRFR